MFEKEAKLFNMDRMPVQALNKPAWAEFNLSMMKVASIDKSNPDTDLHGWDLEAAIKDHPEHLFIKVFAIKKDEVNDNGDAFSAEELMKAAHTFVGVPVFTNHQNDDIEKAKGKVVHAWYDEKKGGIWIVARIDKVAYPRIARGIEEGYITGTSMGAQVQYSLCSICHNKAHTADEYCSHVKNQKNKKVSSRTKCAFYDSKCKPDDKKCPICACEKGEDKYHDLKQAQVHEWNYGIKFIEDSLVVNPACHDCTIDCILNVPAVETKLSKLRNSLKSAAEKAQTFQRLKVASFLSEEETNEVAELEKTAGKIELQKLIEAQNLLEVVMRSMLDQKQQVSTEYVSDLADILKTAQEVTDELDEMGYGQLPSSPMINEYLQNIVGGGGQATPAPQQQQPQQQAAPQMAPPPSGSANMDGVATVTKPSFKGSSGKKEELVTAGGKFKFKIESLRKKLVEALAERKAIQTEGVSDHTNKESGSMEENNTKTAAGSGQTDYNQQVTTEKQLAEKGNSLHPRTETHPEEVTQAQLGGKAKTDVTSDSPQVRLDNSPEVITEAQMAAVKGDEIVRWGTFPEVITEKQWEAMHREVGAVLSEDQSTHITQAQLRDLLSHHTWCDEHNPDVVTESQLAEGGFGDGGTAGNLDRLDSNGVVKGASTYTYNAKKLIDAAVEAMSDAIVSYSKSPEDIVKAASFINNNPQSVIKASYLMLVNAIPPKRAARKEARNRAAYFAKVASDSKSFVKPVDALLSCMADRCSGLKAEDFVGAVGFAVSQKPVMALVDAKVREKIAARDSVEETPTFDKFAALRTAAENLDRSADGLYQIQAPLHEISAPLSDKAAFAKAAVKLAMSNKELPAGVSMTPVEISVHEKASVPFVAVTLKETGKLTTAEVETIQTKKLAAAQKPAVVQKRAAARQQVVKTAQMGGGMPDPMGAAPGAGAAGAPPAGGMPGQQPPAPGIESMDQDPNAGADPAADSSDHEPLPPGSVCPVCTSQDVDIVEGKGKCKACSAEFTYKVNIEVTRWPNTLDKGEDKGEEDGEGGAEGEGFAMPDQGGMGGDAGAGAAGGQDQSIPVAAMTRIDKNIIQKLAAIKDRVTKAAGNEAEMAKIALPVAKGGLGIGLYQQKTIVAGKYMLGEISPLTGSTNTMKLASGAHICLDTGTPYIMETAVAKSDPSRPYIQWRWMPKVAGRECSSCNRVQKAFVAALKTAGKTEAQFEAMDLKSRGELILQLKESGAFGVVKTASKAVDAVSEFKLAYAMPTSVFPMDSCREKLARRFGESTAAMSGPCEGQNLADCVCKSLKKAEVYADMLAIKVASVWALEDASRNCLEDFIREGFSLKQASVCCQALKTKYAQSHEHFLDGISTGGDMGGDAGGDLGGGDVSPQDDGGGLPPDGEDDVDPFADGGGDMNADPNAMDAGGADAGGMGGAAGAVDAVEVAPAPSQVSATPGAPAAGGSGGPTVKLELPLETVLDAVKDSHMNPANPAAGAQLDLEVPAQPVGDAAGDALGGEHGGEVPPTDDASKGDVEVEEDPSDTGSGDFSDDEGGLGEEDKNNNEPVSEETSFSEESPKPEGDAMEEEKAAFASAMKPATIGRTGKIRMDLTGVLAAVNKARQKTASEEGKALAVEQAQDAVPFKYDGGKAIGKEEKFTAEKVKVDSNESQSLMGNEKKVPASMPKVPTGDQRLGHEESHLKPELGNKVTGLGGSEGDVVASVRPYKGSTKDIAYTLAARLVAASEKKHDNVKSTEDTDGVGKLQDGKVHPNAAAEEPFSAADPEIPEKNKGAFMGHEEESIHDVPKPSSEFAPVVPTEKGEKVDETTGNVAASSSVKTQQYKEAMAIAGRMVAEGHITPNELLATVSELREYSPKMLKAFANKLFTKPKIAARKGLNTLSDGTEQPVVISQTDAKKANLSQRIAGLFTLTQQLDSASDNDADFRRKFRR